MSFITRCPACSTMFKVVPDQLRVSDGWVRCGQCDEVFDANINLQADGSAFDEVPQESDVLLDGWDGEVNALNESNADAPTPVIDFDVAVKTPSSSSHALNETQGQAKPHDVATRRSEPFLAPEPPVSESAPLANSVASERIGVNAVVDDGVAKAAKAAPPRFPEVSLSGMPTDESHESSILAVPPTFMQTGQTGQARSRWHHLGVRVGLSLLALGLVSVLLGQMALQEREKLAAHAPGLKPALHMLCEALGCQLGLPREIESVVIESSSFVKVKTGVYKLNVSLKNASKIPLALPSLELTLTDGQDQSIVRKVIDASAIDIQKTGGLPTGVEVSASVPVSVKLPTGAERVSGYRLLAFYP